MERTKRLSSVRHRGRPLRRLAVRLAASCPALGAAPAPRRAPPRARSLPSAALPAAFLPPCPFLRAARAYSTMLKTPSHSPPVWGGAVLPASSQPNKEQKRSYVCKCGCPCPFPCGPFGNACGCNCLPPPCNTPPRCIQYMTGYYYYPYGFWFCGPYHVSGTCCPVSGSCCGCGCGCCGCGCGCGCCGPCGPCGKCCACCVCPAMPVAGAVLPGIMPKSAPKPNSPVKVPQMPSMPNRTPVKSPLKCSSDRVAVSKFFPFSTAVTPNVRCERNNAKSKSLSGPTASSARCYSTPVEVDESAFHDRNYPGNKYLAMPNDGHYSQALKPRKILSSKERDEPYAYTSKFDFSTVPEFKNPYPSHKSIESELRPDEASRV